MLKEQHDGAVNRPCEWKASCYAVAAILPWAARSTCFWYLLGFPGLNHLRVSRLLHGTSRTVSVYSGDGTPHTLSVRRVHRVVQSEPFPLLTESWRPWRSNLR
jgi:hypothetical protein